MVAMKSSSVFGLLLNQTLRVHCTQLHCKAQGSTNGPLASPLEVTPDFIHCRDLQPALSSPHQHQSQLACICFRKLDTSCSFHWTDGVGWRKVPPSVCQSLLWQQEEQLWGMHSSVPPGSLQHPPGRPAGWWLAGLLRRFVSVHDNEVCV